jgi:hypothetical protein
MYGYQEKLQGILKGKKQFKETELTSLLDSEMTVYWIYWTRYFKEL